MNELSLRAALTSVLFGGLTAALAGCPGPAPMGGNGGEGGTGGAGTTTSTTSTTSGSGGGGSCTKPSDCPMMATACAVSDCIDNTCGMSPLPKDTPCGDDNGKMCDGDGKCVECIKPADCASSVEAACMDGVYTAPPTCEAGACVAGASTNCTSMQLGCTKDGCGSCTSDSECDDGAAGECKTNGCVMGNCTKVVTVAADCGMAGTCGVGGECTQAKHVFVTALEVMKGDLGSVDEADKECQEAAKQAHLSGKWLSWTSDNTTSPLMRFSKNLEAYRLLDVAATVVAHNWTSLASGSLVAAIDRDELGNPVPYGTHVWTGTLPNGTHSGASCDGWSNAALAGSYGKVGAAGGGWSKLTDQACTLTARLYCFQQ